MSATKREPAPTVCARSQAVVPWVLDHLERHYVAREALARDLVERAEVGLERYGVPLATHNGRSARVDAYQEALDLVVYAAQDHLERPHVDTDGRYRTDVTLMLALELAERLRRAVGAA